MNKKFAALRAWIRRFRPSRGQPLFHLALAACAGTGLADTLNRLPAAVWAGAVAAAGLTVWVRPSRLTLLLPAMAAFAFAHHARDRDPLRELLAAHVREGGAIPVTVTGVITDDPEPDASGTAFTFPLRTEHLESVLPATAGTTATLYARARDFPVRLHYGDRITLTGILRRPLPPLNPGEFDFPSFLRRQSYSAECEASAAYDRLTVLDRDAGSPVMRAALQARDWIGSTVTQDLTEDPGLAATVRAMVLGTREKTPADIEEAFIASGTMHIFAVSGLHVAMFCSILWSVLRLLRLPHGWVLATALPLVFFYVFITGLRPSAWRAAIMAAVILAGPLFNRESNLLNSLGAAALILLAGDTQQLFQPGFTLSFGVLLSLALLHPLFRRLLRPLGEPDPFIPLALYRARYPVRLWLRRVTAGSLSVSLASTIGSAGLMMHYFRLVTPIGIVANLFLVSLSLAILVLACASLASAAAGLSMISLCFNNSNWLLAGLSIRLARLFAAVPGGHFQCHPARLWRGSPCEITVLHLDNGGGGAHIDTPSGRHWLLDTGGRRHFIRTVRPHLLRTPVNRLDGLLLSHADAHHTGAAEEIRRVFRPEQEPGPNAGEIIQADPEVSIRCLFPPPGWKAAAQDDQTRVFLLECRGVRVLFMNDAGFVTEKALLAGGADLRADVLVSGRHDRDFSLLPEFINAVRPRAAILTHSHFPASESIPDATREMLAAKGVRLFDQSRTGAAVIRIEDGTAAVQGWFDGSEISFTGRRP